MIKASEHVKSLFFVPLFFFSDWFCLVSLYRSETVKYNHACLFLSLLTDTEDGIGAEGRFEESGGVVRQRSGAAAAATADQHPDPQGGPGEAEHPAGR